MMSMFGSFLKVRKILSNFIEDIEALGLEQKGATKTKVSSKEKEKEQSNRPKTATTKK